jgi:hypothetical protein
MSIYYIDNIVIVNGDNNYDSKIHAKLKERERFGYASSKKGERLLFLWLFLHNRK